MKTILVIPIVCALACIAFADEVRVHTTVTTNLTANVIKQIDLHREGDQSLLEVEKLKALRGDMWITTQKVLWHGKPAVAVSTSSFSPDVGVRFFATPGVDAVTTSDSEGKIKQVSLVTSNLQILVACELKNGSLTPFPRETIAKSNDIMQDISGTFGRFIKKESSGDEFMVEIEKIEEKTRQLREHNK
jgi:hypothetical protein